LKIEANQLNTRIFNRTSLSSTNGGGDIVMPDFFLTSSVLSQTDYGDCLNKFKSRMGLSGLQDLYVLVNVTMSPWATTDAQSILNDMVADFQKIAEEEVQVRNYIPMLRIPQDLLALRSLSTVIPLRHKSTTLLCKAQMLCT
jgi:hypothetical protein